MYINHFNETIIYERISHTNPFIDIMLSGITQPNSDYIIGHTGEQDWHVFEYVISGKGHIMYDGIDYIVSVGDFYFYSDTATLTYWADNNDPYKKMFINIRGSIIDNIVSAFKFGELLIQHIDVSDIFRELLSLIEQLDIAPNPTTLRKVSQLMYELSSTVAEQNTIFGSVDNISTAEKIHDYIDNHLTRSITLTDISNKLFISKGYCVRTFHNKYGISPMKYLLEARLKKSKELVASSNLPIQNIAAMFQFCDLQYYSKAFKQYFGISPAQYRESTASEK